MAKLEHSDVLDGRLNSIKNVAIRVAMAPYNTGDSYATVMAAKVAEAVMASGDYTLATSGSNRTLTSAVKNALATVDLLDIVSTRSVTSGSTTTLADSTQAWTVNAYANKVVTIVAGTGAGQSAIITSNTATTLTFPAIATAPDATSTYRINHNLHLIYHDNVGKMLSITDETSNVSVASGSTVNFPSIVWTSYQAT